MNFYGFSMNCRYFIYLLKIKLLLRNIIFDFFIIKLIIGLMELAGFIYIYYKK